MADEFKLNGHNPDETAVEEDDVVALKHLRDLNREGGQVTSMSKNELSLMKGMASPPPDTIDRFTFALHNANFLDDEEAKIHIAAYAEAIRLGMDTEFNIQMLEGLRGTNRKGGYKSNLDAAIFDALSHSKITSNQPRSSSGSANKNSPLA
jgi:hypothetical protein